MQIDMKPLVDLQACDSRILQVLKKREGTPRKIQAIEEEMARMEEDMEEA